MSKYDFLLATLFEAAGVVKEQMAGGLVVSTKNNDVRDVVTNVDVFLSEFITRAIQTKYPEDIIYSEESAMDAGQVESGSKGFWAIDPIDGTSNFSRGIPHYAICISYFEEGEVVMGAALNPVTNELFSVKRGDGAYKNHKRTQVSEIRDLQKAVVCMSVGRSEKLRFWGAELYKKLLMNCKSIKNLGSSSLDFCFVGTGSVEACLYAQLSPIDVAFALLFVQEAGGIVVDENFQVIKKATAQKQKVFAFNSPEILNQIRSLGV